MIRSLRHDSQREMELVALFSCGIDLYSNFVSTCHEVLPQGQLTSDPAYFFPFFFFIFLN